MTIQYFEDITDTTGDLICLSRIMEYENINEGTGLHNKINSNVEDQLAILKSFNVICRNFIVKNIVAQQEWDVMPGHDLTSRLFMKIRFSLDGNHTELAYMARQSIVKEIFFSLYKYLVMSAICGRVEECATCGELNDCENYRNLVDLMVALVITYDYVDFEFKSIYCDEPEVTPESLFDLSRISNRESRAVLMALNLVHGGKHDGADYEYYNK